MKSHILASFVCAGLVMTGCSASEQAAAPEDDVTEEGAREDLAAIQEAAHGRYVEAINRNNVEGMMEVLTDDVVYQGAGAPEIVGRAAVREFIQAYLDDYMQKATANATTTQYTQGGQYMLVPVTVQVPQRAVYRDGRPDN